MQIQAGPCCVTSLRQNAKALALRQQGGHASRKILQSSRGSLLRCRALPIDNQRVMDFLTAEGKSFDDLELDDDYYRALGISKQEAMEEAGMSAYDLDPEGEDVLGEPRSLLSGDDLSDKDAYGPPAVMLAGFPVEEVAGVRALLDEVGAQAVKVVPLFNRLLHCTVERALQEAEPDWESQRPAEWNQAAGSELQYYSRCLLMAGMSPSAMATVVEVLELSGVPTLCASKATHEEAHSKVGEVIAKALQEQRSRKLPKTPDYGGMMMTEDQFEQQQHDSTSKAVAAGIDLSKLDIDSLISPEQRQNIMDSIMNPPSSRGAGSSPVIDLTASPSQPSRRQSRAVPDLEDGEDDTPQPLTPQQIQQLQQQFRPQEPGMQPSNPQPDNFKGFGQRPQQSLAPRNQRSQSIPSQGQRQQQPTLQPRVQSSRERPTTGGGATSDMAKKIQSQFKTAAAQQAQQCTQQAQQQARANQQAAASSRPSTLPSPTQQSPRVQQGIPQQAQQATEQRSQETPFGSSMGTQGTPGGAGVRRPLVRMQPSTGQQGMPPQQPQAASISSPTSRSASQENLLPPKGKLFRGKAAQQAQQQEASTNDRGSFDLADISSPGASAESSRPRWDDAEEDETPQYPFSHVRQQEPSTQQASPPQQADARSPPAEMEEVPLTRDQEEEVMAAEYDKIVGDVDSRFRGLTGPEERKAAMRQEVWEPTRSALQAALQCGITTAEIRSMLDELEAPGQVSPWAWDPLGSPGGPSRASQPTDSSQAAASGGGQPEPPQREVLTREEMEGWNDIVPQASENDSTALLLRGLQDGTLKVPKGWDSVPDSPVPLVGDYVDYEDYMRDAGGKFEN